MRPGVFEKEFGQRVKAARRKEGLTQREMAEKLFVTPNTVLSWEQGRRQPNLFTVCQLAQILHVSAGYLIAGEESKE